MHIKMTYLIDLLVRHLSIVAFIALALLFGYPTYQNWAKQHAIEVAAQEKKEALAQIGVEASITGSIYWAAYKACRKIGIPSVEDCARYDGTLLQEKGAPVLATTAVNERITYDKNCLKLYAKDYCDQLLNRAFHLSQEEPS
jgi:hypothetical protein